MNNDLNIYCVNTGQYIPITGGESLLDIYNRMEPKPHPHPVMARVNNKSEDLRFSVYRPKQVEFLGLEHASAQRAYIRTLCMVMYKAVNDRYPGKRLRFMHSVSGGYYCVFKHDNQPITPEVIDRIQSKMEEIIEHNIPLVGHERLTKDVIEMFRQQGLNDKVRLLSSVHELYTKYYQLGDIIDSFYGPLMPSTGYLQAFDLVPYEGGVLLLGPDWKDTTQVAKLVEQPKMFNAFTEYTQFNDIIGIDDVGYLNHAIKSQYASLLINVAEALHNRKFGEMAYDITQRYKQGGARVVLIAGPSSSGKTTSSKRLAIQLVANYIRPKVIELDNYFVNRDQTPRDETGDYDYESIYALDLAQFNQDMEDLLAGKEVKMPTYNFALGQREYRGNTMRLEKNNVLLIEGIHGLNPLLTQGIAEDQKYRIFVSALTTLSIDDHNWIPTTDNRLLRRIVRDAKYRGASARDTIARWPSVRRGEEKWILPYQENADAMFNSSLLFELAVMKEYAEPILKEVPADCPEYAEAWRLLKFLSYFESLEEKDIPRTSLLREFLGGSSFHY